MKKLIRLLMVEDVESDAALIREELKKTGEIFDIRRVSTADEFENELIEHTPDLILSNYELSSYDGLSALETIKQMRLDVPFIFISWNIHEQTLIEIMKLGATDYIFKEQLSRLPLSVVRALREAEEKRQLRQSQQAVMDQERLGALGKMASGITHDFSNALMPVLGFAELLLHHPENRKDEAKLTKYLELIHTSAKDAMTLVAQLRDFYRRKKEGETYFPVDLKQIVEQAVLFARIRWKDEALSRGAVIKVETELEGLPKILGNDSALREMMTNLLFNAIDAMPQGGTISCVARPEGRRVRLEVRDTGQGMDEATRQHCFEPFFSTKGRAGTGMGLAMVYGIIRRHHGTVELQSAPGAGTSFVIRLPVADSEISVEDQKATPKPERFLKVLVVDDELLVRRVLKEYLIQDGHEVTTAREGGEGLEKFKKGRFDVVFTDWAMPGMNGDELAASIKILSSVPIILLTGFAEKAEAVAVNAVLNKPATLQSVRQALQKALS